MRITLHCLDCGFQIAVTMPAREAADAKVTTLSCGQCGCRRWAAV
jgi:transcription elongation factor Elf1